MESPDRVTAIMSELQRRELLSLCVTVEVSRVRPARPLADPVLISLCLSFSPEKLQRRSCCWLTRESTNQRAESLTSCLLVSTSCLLMLLQEALCGRHEGDSDDDPDGAAESV